MSHENKELIVCKNYRLVKKLGTGAFGEIYLAENKNNPSQKLAAKLEQATTKFPQLYYEAKIYKYLGSFGTVPGIPKVHAITTQGQYNVMLMDLLGSSLEDLFLDNGKRMSLKTVLQLGDQMIDRIQGLHEKSILHRDIKPDNFLMGIGKNAHIVYILDFGLSKKYIHDNKHIPYKEGKELTGTARYASISTHMGIEQSRRDDIESIGYVLMYLLRGILPWQNMKAKDTKTKYKMIMQKKMSTPAQFLCKGFPGEMVSFLNYAKGLKFQQKPDYKYLKSLLATARKNNKIQMDYVYDWTIKSSVATLKMQMSSNIDDSKLQRSKGKEDKLGDHRRSRKEEVIDQALNNFNIPPANMIKSSHVNSNTFNKDSNKQTLKNSNKSGAIKNQGTLLSSAGLQTLVSKIATSKISVPRKI